MPPKKVAAKNVAAPKKAHVAPNSKMVYPHQIVLAQKQFKIAEKAFSDNAFPLRKVVIKSDDGATTRTKEDLMITGNGPFYGELSKAKFAQCLDDCFGSEDEDEWRKFYQAGENIENTRERMKRFLTTFVLTAERSIQLIGRLVTRGPNGVITIALPAALRDKAARLALMAKLSGHGKLRAKRSGEVNDGYIIFCNHLHVQLLAAFQQRTLTTCQAPLTSNGLKTLRTILNALDNTGDIVKVGATTLNNQVVFTSRSSANNPVRAGGSNAGFLLASLWGRLTSMGMKLRGVDDSDETEDSDNEGDEDLDDEDDDNDDNEGGDNEDEDDEGGDQDDDDEDDQDDDDDSDEGDDKPKRRNLVYTYRIFDDEISITFLCTFASTDDSAGRDAVVGATAAAEQWARRVLDTDQTEVTTTTQSNMLYIIRKVDTTADPTDRVAISLADTVMLPTTDKLPRLPIVQRKTERYDAPCSDEIKKQSCAPPPHSS